MTRNIGYTFLMNHDTLLHLESPATHTHIHTYMVCTRIIVIMIIIIIIHLSVICVYTCDMICIIYVYV